MMCYSKHRVPTHIVSGGSFTSQALDLYRVWTGALILIKTYLTNGVSHLSQIYKSSRGMDNNASSDICFTHDHNLDTSLLYTSY